MRSRPRVSHERADVGVSGAPVVPGVPAEFPCALGELPAVCAAVSDRATRGGADGAGSVDPRLARADRNHAGTPTPAHAHAMSALVSICSWCPDARDQTTRARAAGQRVTHGICQDCLHELEREDHMDATTPEPITPITMTDCTDCWAVPGADHIIDVIHPRTGLTWCLGKSAADVHAQAPRAERMTIEAWTAAKAARQRTPIVWEPSTRQQYIDMLEVLPPIDWNGGDFLVGEASDHDAGTGQPRYQAYRQRGDQYFASSRAITRAELRAVKEGLREATNERPRV